MEKKCNILLLSICFLAILFTNCNKPVELVVIDETFIVSEDTLIFHGNGTKGLFLSTNSTQQCYYAVTSYPEWVEIYPSYGFIDAGEEVRLVVTAEIEDLPSAIYTGEIQITSDFGDKTIFLIGSTDETSQYTITKNIYFAAHSNSEKIIINNLGNTSIQYSASNTQSGIELVPSEGEIPAFSQSEIIINIDKNVFLPYNTNPTVQVMINDTVRDVVIHIENKRIISNEISRLEYSKPTNKIVYINSDLAVYIYDITTNSTESIPLSYIPLCLSLSSDGTKAAIGHDAHISYVDLETKEILTENSVPYNVKEIVLGDNGWAYFIPKIESWKSLHAINIKVTNSNEQTLTWPSIIDDSKIKLHPSGKYIYCSDYSNLKKFDIQNDTAIYLYESDLQHGSIGYNIWFSEDATRIFAAGKNVVRSSDIQSQDMTHTGTISLDGAPQGHSIAWMDQCEAKKNLYIITTPSYYSDDDDVAYVYIHNSDDLTFNEKIEIEPYFIPNNWESVSYAYAKPYYVFSNSNNEIYVITKPRIQTLENDWAIQTLRIGE